MLNGETLGDVDAAGEPVKDDTFLIMLNCHHEPIQFFMPQPVIADKWEIIIDTNDPALEPKMRYCEPGSPVELVPLSLVEARDAKPASVSRLLNPEGQ